MRKVLVGIAQIVIIVIVVIFSVQIISIIDGIFNPVVADWSIEKIESHTDSNSGPSTIDVSYTKIRECDYIGTEWFFGNLGANAQVSAILTSEPKIRTIGEHAVTYEIGLSDYNILNNSYAYLIHDCYNGWLWFTKTPFIESTALNPSGT